jgi:aminotransferase
MHTARRTHGFTESVIRAMTRLAAEHRAINLAQGFPNFPCPEVLKEAAAKAIRDNINQYAITWGSKRLRQALAGKYADWYGLAVNPETELTVTCGATEAMISTLLAIVDPGDEVIIFEPFYENYGPDAILCGAKPVYLPIAAGQPLDLDRLRKAFSKRTRAIIVNTPNNPSGRVLTRAELEAIAALCRRHDAWAVTDEIYEHIYYQGEHIPMATLPDMRERTITTSGASKTFSVTGWRIGTIVAPARVTDAIRKVHDFLTVGAPAPLQEGVAAAIEQLGDDYYRDLARDYRARRDVLMAGLRAAGFGATAPEGAYYVLADFTALSDLPDDEFAFWLTREVGVAPVPGSSFYSRPALGRHQVRFAFCKTLDLLQEAAQRLTAHGSWPRAASAVKRQRSAAKPAARRAPAARAGGRSRRSRRT